MAFNAKVAGLTRQASTAVMGIEGVGEKSGGRFRWIERLHSRRLSPLRGFLPLAYLCRNGAEKARKTRGKRLLPRAGVSPLCLK